MTNETLPAVSGKNGHDATGTDQGFGMPDLEPEAPRSGMGPHDIIFMLFRHKWKILLCASAGLLAAAGVYFILPPVYTSEAKLFVRYVVDKSAIDGTRLPDQNS